MERDRKAKVLAVIAICIALLGLSTGFAAFSTTLQIKGTAKAVASSWKVRFENLQPVAKTGTAEELVAPTINTLDTVLSTYDVTLKTPGDSVTYVVDIANRGTFDAEITNIVIPTPTCTGTGDTATADQTNVCTNLTYTLTYNDGTPIQNGDTLNVSEVKTVKLTLTYNANMEADKLPANDVTIGGLDISITYSQK